MWKKELDTLEGKTVPMEIKKNTYTTILHYILQFVNVKYFWHKTSDNNSFEKEKLFIPNLFWRVLVKAS